jgi:hypothetical protein
MGPPLALRPEPALAGLSDPAPAAPGGVELVVGLLTGFESEATRLPATTSDCAMAVLDVRTLISSLLSWISTMSNELGVVVLALAP